MTSTRILTVLKFSFDRTLKPVIDARRHLAVGACALTFAEIIL